MYAKRRANRSTCWTDFSPSIGNRPSSVPPAYIGGPGGHPLARQQDNAALACYEESVKGAFDRIEGVLRSIAAMQHEAAFEQTAQAVSRETLGYALPAEVLAKAWVDPLDMRALYAWCVFETYCEWVEHYYRQPMDFGLDAQEFSMFLQSCGYHYLDFTPCADGRLAHAIRYVLRLLKSMLWRKAHAGAMFVVEDSRGGGGGGGRGRGRGGGPGAHGAR